MEEIEKKWEKYEEEKQQLREQNLTPKEYTKKILEIIKEIGL